MFDPLAPHSHNPNPHPPTANPDVTVVVDGGTRTFTVMDLQKLPASTCADCYIISTGHGVSGPFAFTGILLAELAAQVLPAGSGWTRTEIYGADGFGTRLDAAEVALLAWAIDGEPMPRSRGLVRLVAPGERGSALKQVKWVAMIRLNTD